MHRSITPLRFAAFATFVTAGLIAAGCGAGAGSEAPATAKPSTPAAVATAVTVVATARSTTAGPAAPAPTIAAIDVSTVNPNPPGAPVLTGALQRTPSGLGYIDEVVGTGAATAAGQTVSAHYTGWLTTGQKFDSSRDRGQPFSFVLGRGQVIGAWDEALASMKVGGKRRLIVPPALGYGARGTQGIPPNATLIFDVELVGVR